MSRKARGTRGGAPPVRVGGTSVAVIALFVVAIVIALGGGYAGCRCIAVPPGSKTTRGISAPATTGRIPAPVSAPRPHRIPSARSDALRVPDGTGGDAGAAGAAGGSGTGSEDGGSIEDITADDPGTSTSTGTLTTSSEPACAGLECQVQACPGGGSTTIAGTVYDPAGKRPLYGVVVYVPNEKPAPLGSGASCSTCGDLYTGDPIASAITDATGKFVLRDAPDGPNIPLVIQVGKWRRQLVLPSVGRCTSTAVPDRTLTLPKNGREGDLPSIAISTGGGDSLECLLRRMGVDDSEYVAGAGGAGHVHVFKGNDAGPEYPAPDTSPGAPDPSVALWGSIADIMRYDMVLLSCEGYPRAHPNQQVMFEYAAAGGRVFASHSHYAWFDTGPFGAANLAAWTTGTHEGGTSFGAGIVTTTWANQPFARGQAFADWLLNADALTGSDLPIESPPSFNAYVTAANTPSQPWIVANNRTAATLDFSFDTPIGAAPACGRVAFADMHVGPGAGDYTSGPGKITPSGCASNDLRPQEKALEYILFDLSSCVTPGNVPQQPPTGG